MIVYCKRRPPVGEMIAQVRTHRRNGVDYIHFRGRVTAVLDYEDGSAGITCQAVKHEGDSVWTDPSRGDHFVDGYPFNYAWPTFLYRWLREVEP